MTSAIILRTGMLGLLACMFGAVALATALRSAKQQEEARATEREAAVREMAGEMEVPDEKRRG